MNKKLLSNFVAKLQAWHADLKRQQEIALIRTELEELRGWRDIGNHRVPRLYKRLVELGEYVPGYMPPASASTQWADELLKTARLV